MSWTKFWSGHLVLWRKAVRLGSAKEFKDWANKHSYQYLKIRANAKRRFMRVRRLFYQRIRYDIAKGAKLFN